MYEAEVLSRLARGPKSIPGLELAIGNTIDISEYLDFTMWNLVWYWDPSVNDDMSDDIRKLGRWLGVAHRVGTAMVYWILTESCKIIARSTVQHCTREDQEQEVVKKRLALFDEAIDKQLRNPTIVNQHNVFYLEDQPDPADTAPWYNEFNPNHQESTVITPKPNTDDESFDQYLNAEILIDRGGDEKVHARVTKRARDNDGNPIGIRNSNPLLDTRIYECVTEDGVSERYTANQIAQNIYATCDEDGFEHILLKEIIDHRSDASAIKIADGFTLGKNGNRIPKKMTKGWRFLCEWKDGTTTWVPLVDLKDSNPVDVAEYVIAHQLQEEPAFKWWVSHVIHKRNRIISKLKARLRRVTHKFGIRLPRTITEALEIDKETGTDFWWNAIKRELDKIMVAFDIDQETTPEDIRKNIANGKYVGYQEIKCHWIFDIKMDLTRRARFVAGGHTTYSGKYNIFQCCIAR